MPDYECFDVELGGQVAHLRLNRPEALNTMTRAFWRELPDIIGDMVGGARAQCVVISSTGRHFSAGMDLAVLTSDQEPFGDDPAIRAERFRHEVRLLQDAFTCLDEARIPVLAAIQGGCIGGAVDMTSACDIRYATRDAFFCIQEINIAMTADVGTFPRLCMLIPEGQVRELAFTGRRLTAERAKAIGLVNEVFDTQEAMLEHVLAIAREIAARAPLAITGSKAMINYARDHSLQDGLDQVALWNAAVISPAQMQEAMQAAREKRAPRLPDLLPMP